MKPTILILDNHSIPGALSRVLETADYDVSRASTGLDAIDIFRSCRVHLVILDLDRDEEDGWSVFEAIKGLNPFIPAIVTTGKTDQREKAIKSGADALIEKPLDVAAALRVVDELLTETNEQRFKRVSDTHEYCRYVAGCGDLYLEQLEERHSAPLKLSRSLSAVISIRVAPGGSRKSLRELIECA